MRHRAWIQRPVTRRVTCLRGLPYQDTYSLPLTAEVSTFGIVYEGEQIIKFSRRFSERLPQRSDKPKLHVEDSQAGFLRSGSNIARYRNSYTPQNSLLMYNHLYCTPGCALMTWTYVVAHRPRSWTWCVTHCSENPLSCSGRVFAVSILVGSSSPIIKVVKTVWNITKNESLTTVLGTYDQRNLGQFLKPSLGYIWSLLKRKFYMKYT